MTYNSVSPNSEFETVYTHKTGEIKGKLEKLLHTCVIQAIQRLPQNDTNIWRPNYISVNKEGNVWTFEPGNHQNRLEKGLVEFMRTPIAQFGTVSDLYVDCFSQIEAANQHYSHNQ